MKVASLTPLTHALRFMIWLPPVPPCSARLDLKHKPHSQGHLLATPEHAPAATAREAMTYALVNNQGFGNEHSDIINGFLIG